MRVLVVSHYALPHVGGVENLVDLEIRGLTAAGHTVTLLTSDGQGMGTPPAYSTAVHTIRVWAWHGLERRFGVPYPIFSPWLLPVLWREVGRCDLVHAHGFMFVNTAFAILAARMRGTPSVLTDHGGIQRLGSKLATLLARIGAETVGRLSAHLAGRGIAYNGRVLATLARLGRRGDGEFLANAIDRSVFHPPSMEERASARRALGWASDRRKVLFVGRLIAAKGIPLLLASAHPDYDLVFCGPGDPAILGAVPRPGVEYLPPRPQSDVRALYHAADALALPADVREGFPLVVQEALACGLPVVLGYDPGFEPYRRLPGLIFTERTPKAVRLAICQALLMQTGTDRTGELFPSIEAWCEELVRMPSSTVARGSRA